MEAKIEKIRLFVDMDGTLAEWRPSKSLEELCEDGYFRSLNPYKNVVDAVRKVVNERSDEVEVFILSAYLTDSKTALSDKNAWLDEFLPEIDAAHRVFCPCGSDKSKAVPEGIKDTDRLLDDYTVNLFDWCPPGFGIKLLNGINDTHKSWPGERIDKDNLTAEDIYDRIMINCFRSRQTVYDTSWKYGQSPFYMEDAPLEPSFEETLEFAKENYQKRKAGEKRNTPSNTQKNKNKER